MQRSTEVAIVGGGPAGLVLARELAAREIEHLVLEMSDGSGGTYRGLHPEFLLNSPTRFNALPGLELGGPEYTTAGAYALYLERYREWSGIRPRLGTRVESLRRCREGFELGTRAAPADLAASAGSGRPAEGGSILARLAVACTGMWSFPRTRVELPGLDRAGIPVRHYRDYPGPEGYRGRTVLVVGGANSAVELAASLCPGTRVLLWARSGVHLVRQHYLGLELHDYARVIEGTIPRWLARSVCRGAPPIPGFRHLHDAARATGNLTVLDAPPTLEPGGLRRRDRSWIALDEILLATGFDYRLPYLDLEHPLQPGGHPVMTAAGESPVSPGLFFLGYPCTRSLASPYLRGIAADAPRLAATLERRLRSGAC